nr:tRNA dihydrouridine synthase [Colletotrichum truncatum]KAF6788560.1 tRNA dihydrouridine synthase [Colletotrichum truncatum]
MISEADTVKTRLLVISDTHGRQLEYEQEADVAIHCGDLTNESKLDEYRSVIKNLSSIKAPLKLIVPGNHDFSLDIPQFQRKIDQVRQQYADSKGKDFARKYGAPGDAHRLFEAASDAGIVLLDQQGLHIFTLTNGARLTVYASPYTPHAGGFWGFQYRFEEGHDFDIPERQVIVKETRIRSSTTMGSEIKKVPIPRRGVDYRGKIVLAPMVRSGELPSRLLALHYGADLVWGPETVDKAMIGTTRRVNPVTNTIDWTKIPSFGQKNPPKTIPEAVVFSTHPEKEAGKLIFQIGTADPDLAVQAARLVAADVSGIDVNAGCPKPFSISGGMGAALLKTPDKLCAILEALVANIMPEFEIGISVKIRLLDTPEQTEALVRKLCATGITGLTIHCRTTPMRPRERAIREQLRMVAGVCHDAGVACIMNGDVESRDHAVDLIKEYGVDGAMIATAAEANSSCFRSKEDGGVAGWEEVAAAYIKYALEVDNKFGNTKYLLCQIVPGKSGMYQKMNQCKTYTQVCRALGLEDLMELAQQTDINKGIDPEKTGKAGKMSNPSAMAAGGKMTGNRSSQAPRKKSERGVTVPADKQQASVPLQT